ncbi:MAG: flavodoxin family protein [Bacillota bacterium]
MAKTIVALAGSPKKRGATGMLMEAAVRGAKDSGADVEVIYANNVDIKPCQGNGHCLKLNGCIYQDDMVQFQDSFLTADGFIISSPVYFGSVTAQLKIIIDRCQVFWAIKQNSKTVPLGGKWRPLVFIATSGLDNKKGDRFDGSLEVIKNLGYALDFNIFQTILVANTDQVPLLETSPEIAQAYRAGKLLGEKIFKEEDTPHK